MKVLKFSASWCGPCSSLKKVIDSIDDLGVEVQEVDIDENVELSTQYGIRNIPTCILVDDEGFELSRKTGMMTKEQFIQFSNGS